MMHRLTKIAPVVMIVLDVVAAFAYFADRDYKRGLYWLCGAVMVALVTFE